MKIVISLLLITFSVFVSAAEKQTTKVSEKTAVPSTEKSLEKTTGSNKDKATEPKVVGTKEQQEAKILEVEKIVPVQRSKDVKVDDEDEDKPSTNRNSGSFWEFRASIGLDFQISDNEINGGAYADPDEDVLIGGSGGFFVRHRFNDRFGISTGGELVARKIEQDYGAWLILFSTDPGVTRYDIFSLEIPIYAELYMGNGNHTLYIGPKIATPLYDHCNNDVNDPNRALPCMDDAVRSIFIPVQFGYHLWLNQVFGMTFFIETTVTPVVDKGPLESKSTRTGALATFYF